MGALVAYTGNPNPATLAQFATAYQNAVTEWNQSLRAVWSAAGPGFNPYWGGLSEFTI